MVFNIKRKIKVGKEKPIEFRGFAFYETKDGKTHHYDMRGYSDGYYLVGISKDNNTEKIKLTNSLRNWMFAQNKAKEVFRQKTEKAKQEGKYKSSYNSMWSESSGGHTYSYEKQPQTVTPLRKYGTHPYNLGFEVNENQHEENGKYIFDATYYSLNWKPNGDKPNTIFIEKSPYKNGESQGKEIGEEVSVDDKKGVARLIKKFKSIYKSEKQKKR
jgi:hypothetical protein